MNDATFQRIDFTGRRPHHYTVGRNGCSFANGLTLSVYWPGDLIIENINTKGDTTRAAIVCPAEQIPDLIAALQLLEQKP